MVEEAPNWKWPIQEQLEEDLTQQVQAERLPELDIEILIVVKNQSEGLHYRIRELTLQDVLEPFEEIYVVECWRQELLLSRQKFQVPVYDLQPLHQLVAVVGVGFLEDGQH